MRYAFVKSGAVVAALVASVAMAGAQSYPTKPIHFIATEVPGSATDIQARIIAKGMAEELGQPIEIENLFGEAGLTKGIRSAPDGYTMVYGGSGTLALLPNIKKVSFDPLHDLTPVGRFAMAGVKPVVVHYPGGGPAIDAVVSGDAQWTMAPIAGRLPNVRTGKLRALATGGPTRLSMLPDVPTVAESGYPGYNAVGWSGIYVPNGTPQPIIDKLNAAIVKAVAKPEIKKLFEEQGVEGAASTQAEVAKMLQEDFVRLGDLARSIGVHAE